MAWNSTLDRKSPLKSKKGFQARGGFRRKPDGQQPKAAEKKSQEARKRTERPKPQTRSSLTVHLDIVFSLYIRLRDADAGGMCRCISCGRRIPFSQIQCGHLFTRHNMSVRWDEQNCNPQCGECNCGKSGNIESYRPRLIERIGLEAFEALCERAHGVRKWSGDELREMIRHYTAEVKRLSKEKGITVRI